MTYYFAISNKPQKDWLGRTCYTLVYNTQSHLPLNDRHLPKGLRKKLEDLGWNEECKAFCCRLDDGQTNDQLIKTIETTIPEITYCKNLEKAFDDC